VPRRREGVLLPLEERVLTLALAGRVAGDAEFHGFALARDLEALGGRGLTAHGTLYKVLERLERQGLLSSRWETDEEMAPDRPRRRLYSVTDDAAPALRRAESLQAGRAPALRPGTATT